jgi:hypothetical protein
MSVDNLVPNGAQLTDPGILGRYHNGMNFASLIFQRLDPVVDFAWPVGRPPASGTSKLDRNNYSISWSGYLQVPPTVSRPVIFHTISDDGVRLWVYPLNTPRPSPIVNNWTLHASAVDDSEPLSLAAATIYHLQLDYFQAAEPGTIRLLYFFEGDDSAFAQVVPTEWLYAALG